MSANPIVKISFKEQMLQAREDAIIQSVNRLLADKGFEAMTVDGSNCKLMRIPADRRLRWAYGFQLRSKTRT